MKRTLFRVTLVLGVASGVALARMAWADDSTGVERQEKAETFKGTVTSVDQQNKMVWVHHFLKTKRFNIADDCTITFQDKPDAAMTDIRQGQELQVSYETTHGVRVAHHIQQFDLKFTGHVMDLDPAQHILVLRRHALDKTFRLPADCKVVLRGGKDGTLSDVQGGHLVTVIYEVPEDHATARQIDQTSETFSGTLTAVDLDNRTVRAKAMLGEKTFNLSGDCAIVLGNKPGAKLRDLKLGDKLVFSYDDVSGVNVVNRIATSGAAPEPVALSSHDAASTSRPIPPE